MAAGGPGRKNLGRMQLLPAFIASGLSVCAAANATATSTAAAAATIAILLGHQIPPCLAFPLKWNARDFQGIF